MKVRFFLESVGKFISILSLALSLTSTQEAKAQLSKDTLRANLDPIEVKSVHSIISSQNSPFSLSMLINSDRELLHSSPVTLDEMFNQMPGVWVNDRENYALGERMMVRGIGWRAQFGVRGIQVVMDGIPLTMADGQAMLNVIDPSFIRRAELIRGPSSMFWGNSSGGVLYLTTTPPMNTQFPFLVRSTVGSYGLFKSDVQFTQRFGNHGISGYASYMDQNGFRDHSEVQLGRAGVTGAVDLSSDSRIEYFGAYASMPYAEHPSGLTKHEAEKHPASANQSFKDIGAGKKINQGQLGINFTNNSSLGFMQATLYGNFRQLENPLTFGIIDLGRKAGGGRISLQKELNQFIFSIGIESKVQYDDRREYDNNNGSRGTIYVNQLEKVYNHALFLGSAYSLNRFQLLGSLRYDWIRFNTDATTRSQSGNRSFQAVSPGIGLSYSLGDVKLYGNLSTGFEVPTTTELVNRPGGGNGFNPELEPEKTLGLEIGSRGQLFSPKFSYDVALYHLWISDLLFPYQLETDGPTYYRNQGETQHQGIEASIQYDVSSTLQVRLIYNLTHAEFARAETLEGESLEGQEIPGVPKHRLSGSMRWRFGKLWITANAQYVSKFPVDNLNSAYNEEYFVLDSRLSYTGVPLGNQIELNPFIAINNVWDTRYNGSVVVNAFGGRYYEPAAGRSWRGGISLEF